MMSDKKMKRQKDKKAKRHRDKKTKRQKDKKTAIQDKDQKETFILRRQGSFALLRCFSLDIAVITAKH